MRISWLLPLLTLASPILAIPADPAPQAAATTEDAAEADTGPKSTKFNGVEVPPLRELSGETINADIKQGYWFIEFFSPYCHHCQMQAPILQTLYEYYYTLDPLANQKKPDSDKDAQDLNSFTRFYNFKFAKLDCVAFGTACNDKGVGSFPTLILFKDGKEVKQKVGTQSLKELSQWVEEILESIRPGSRPKDGPVLPTVGAHQVDSTAKPKEPESKDKDPEAGKKAGEKHNAVASSVASAAATSTSTGASAKTPSKPKQTANPAGKSVSLTAESFQKLVTTTRDPWFIKFYAPWCGHCQAMAPSWASMAREMQGTLNIGEVNCDIEKRLCKDVKTKGFPTLLFFRGGERVEYTGLRGVGDLISFSRNAIDVGSGVIDVDQKTFEKLEETEEVLFVYFYDHATTTEDFSALERLTLSLIGHAKLVRTKDPALAKRYGISTWPRLAVSRSGKASYYPHLAPKDMRDFRKVLAWMKGVWQPIVPELTAANAREIMDHKVVVLGILSRERSDEFLIAKREIKNAALEWMEREAHAVKLERQELRDAKQLRIEEAEDRNNEKALRAAKAIRINMDDVERREVGFAWVDGVFWERWIRTTFGIDVKDGERVVINDEENRRYWDQTSTGNPIVPSRTSILETLPKTLKNPPSLTPKSTNSALFHVFWSLKTTWSRHPWLSSFGLIAACVLAVVLGRKAKRRGANGGGAIWLDEKGGPFGGILGNTGSAGKVD